MSQVEEARDLYDALLDAWNRRDAEAMGALFTPDGEIIGFDGSSHVGEAIAREVGAIFDSHQTAPYVGKVRSVRLLEPKVALLRAVAGMVPPGSSELDPGLNAIQTMLAVHCPDGWRIAHFQNTPAAYHGRPELSEALTNELRAVQQA